MSAGYARAVLVLAALAALGAHASRAGAQLSPSIEMRVLPESDPLPATPRVIASARNIPATAYPVSIQLDAARSRVFSGVFFSATLPGDTVTFVTRALFPANDSVFLRVTLRDNAGRALVERVEGFRTAPRLTLRSPGGPFGVVLTTRQPLFVWGAARVETPPGPWVFDLSVINANTNEVAFLLPDIVDTVVTPSLPLEANTPYRWQVRARLGNGPDTATTVAVSQSTFVIQSEDAPTVTLLYQNFPNPFPTPVTRRTCIWFDLRARARVSLVIRDLRGNLVRRLVDNESLSAGGYGRSGEGSNAGCADAFAWDGTTADGRTVPAGVYLLHFRADGVETVRKILFRGG